MGDTAVETAALAGVTCASILYGVYLIIFSGCMYILTRKRSGPGVPAHWVLLTAVLIQFVLSTIYTATQLRMMFQSFVWLPSSSQSNGISESQSFTTAQYWLNIGQPIQVFSSTVCFANTVVGDAILVWRLYVVWNNNMLVSIPPTITLLASTICASVMTGLQAQDIYGAITPLGLTTWSLSIGTQVFATGLICWKIWSINSSSAFASKQYTALIWVIVESGAIYSGLAAALLVMYGLREQYSVVLMGCMGQLSAIIPAIIIIRVRWNSDDTIRYSLSTDVRMATSSIHFASNGGPLRSHSSSIEQITKG